MHREGWEGLGIWQGCTLVLLQHRESRLGVQMWQRHHIWHWIQQSWICFWSDDSYKEKSSGGFNDHIQSTHSKDFGNTKLPVSLAFNFISKHNVKLIRFNSAVNIALWCICIQLRLRRLFSFCFFYCFGWIFEVGEQLEMLFVLQNPPTCQLLRKCSLPQPFPALHLDEKHSWGYKTLPILFPRALGSHWPFKRKLEEVAAFLASSSITGLCLFFEVSALFLSFQP